MPINLGCTMVELIDAINEAGEGSEPYHIELTGTSGTITQAQFDALAADDQSYITWKSSTSSTEKFVYSRQRYNPATSATDTTIILNYVNAYSLAAPTSIYIKKNLAWAKSNVTLQQAAYKVSAITDSNKTSTTSYPSVKAVVDYVAAQGGGGTPTNMVTTDTDQQIQGKKTFTASPYFDTGAAVGIEGIEINNANESGTTTLANRFWDGQQLDYTARVNLPVVDAQEGSDVVMPATVDEGTKGFFLTSGGGDGMACVWKGLSYYNVNFAIKRSSSIIVYISWGVVAPSGYKTVKALIQGITGSTSSKLNIPTSVSNYTYSGTTYSLGYLSTNGTPSGTTAYNTNGSSFTPYYSSSSETIGSIAAEFQFFK